MSRQAIAASVSAIVCLSVLATLAGCRLPSGPRDASPEDLRSAPASRIAAFQSPDGRSLAVRFEVRGRDIRATASLPRREPVGNRVQGESATLEFGPDAVREFRALASRRGRVPVLTHAAWNRMSRALAGRLAPSAPGTATLVVAAGRETLLTRNRQGNVALSGLRTRPPGLRIVRTVRSGEFLRELDAVLAADAEGSRALRGPVLVPTGGVPALVLIDRPGQRLVFLHIPAAQSAGLPLPGATVAETTARGLFSLGWRSGVQPVLKNPFSTVFRSTGNVLSAAASAVRGLVQALPAAPPPPVRNAPAMDLAAWERELDEMVGSPAIPAALRFRIGGGEFFPDFVQAVLNARESIDVQVYIFDNDDVALGIADLLRRRSHEVPVRLLLDEAASLQAALTDPPGMEPSVARPADIVDYLRRGSRIRVRPMSMAGLVANHAKLIAIDGRLAWLGGMNIGREYRHGWHDMMIEVRGPLVRRIEDDFAGSWAHAGWGGDYAALWRRLHAPSRRLPDLPAPDDAIPVRPLYTTTWRHEILEAQVEAMRRAQRYVYIQNAYASDTGFLTEMIRARHRGVDVRIVIPEDNDNTIMAANNRAIVPLLLEHGVRVFLLPGMSHIKAAVYDGWACAGSANYDRLSLRVNDEISIGFSDPKTVGVLLRDLFENDFRRSREITGAPEVDLLDSLLQTLASQL